MEGNGLGQSTARAVQRRHASEENIEEPDVSSYFGEEQNPRNDTTFSLNTAKQCREA
jgi:hypothetical protein